MAEILQTEAANRVGLPSVSPSATPPDDYQRIQTNPGQFGGLIAQGEERLSQGIGKAGQFYSQVAADDATNQYMEGTHKILYGTGQIDPATGQADTGYYGLKGKAALAARPQVEAQLEQLQKNIRGGLITPEQQLGFDSNTRRIKYYIGSEMGRFSDQQTDAYATDVNQTGYKNELQAVSSRPEDDVFAAGAAQRALGYRIKLAQISGEADDPEKLAQIRTNTAQDITEARIKALIPTNAPRAMDLLNQNKSFLQGSGNYDALYNAVHGKLVQQQGTAIGQKAIQDAGTSIAQTGTASTINQAILGQEKSGPDQVSVNGAVGVAQMMPATFQQYARPGEVITNPDDNLAAANRAIDDYSQRWPGDPARVAVAYFSGPGNVAPVGSPTPWINNAKDGNGKSVSSYVADIAQRMQGASPHMALKASAYDIAMKSSDDPQVQQEALRYIREQYDAAQVASLADEKAKKDASDKAGNTYVSRILTGDVNGIVQQIANDPNLDYHAKEQISDFAIQHGQSDVDKVSQAYGPGYWNIYRSITDPDNAKARITDQKQIFNLAGPGVPPGQSLTLAGVNNLLGLLQGRKTPEGAAEQKMQAGALNVIKRELSGEDSLPGLKDPHGERIFQHALPMIYQAIEKGKAAGVPVGQLYDPESKDWIGNAVTGLKRSPSEYYADLVNSNGGGANEKAAVPPDITKMTVSQLADAFYAAKTNEEKVRYSDEAVRRGLAAPAKPKVPADSIPQAPLAR